MVSTGQSGSSFPKWQIAVALGTTGVIGLGYWYLRKNSIKNKKMNYAKKKIDSDMNSLSLDDSSDQQPVVVEETPLQKANRLKNEGNSLFKTGKYDEAISFYNQAIEACPREKNIDLAIIYQNRGAAYENLKKWSSVKEDCTKALELNPKYIKALVRRAKAYEITNEHANALDDITAVCLLEKFQTHSSLILADKILRQLGEKHAKEAMLTRKPIMPSRYFIKVFFGSFSNDPLKSQLEAININSTENLKGFNRALYALKTHNFDDIISACNEEIDCSESEAQYKTEAMLLRGTFYLLIGSHSKAVSDLTAVYENQETDPKLKVNALIKHAALNMQLENIDESMNLFKKALEIDSNNSDIYHHRAQYLLLGGKAEQAIIDFNKAIELNPNFAVSHAQKCYTEYRQAASEMNLGKLSSALEGFQEMLKKFPNCSEGYSLYAQVLLDQQQYEESDKYFLKTMELDSDNATVYVQRAVLTLQWKSDVETAISYIRAALEKDSKCEYAYEALGSIEVQRGKLKQGVELFEKALELAKTEAEMTHLFSLKDAASAQIRIATKLDLDEELL